MADAALDPLAGHEPGDAQPADLEASDVPFAHLPDHQDGIEIHQAGDDVAHFEEVAQIHVAVVDEAGERRANDRVVEIDLGALDRRFGAFQFGERGGQLGLGAKTLLGQLLRCLVLDPPLLQQRLGLGEARRAVFGRQPHQRIAFGNRHAALDGQLDDAAMGLGARLDLAQRLGAPAQDHGGLVRHRALQPDADLGQALAQAQVGRRLARDILGLNPAQLARADPGGGYKRQSGSDEEGTPHTRSP